MLQDTASFHYLIIIVIAMPSNAVHSPITLLILGYTGITLHVKQCKLMNISNMYPNMS